MALDKVPMLGDYVEIEGPGDQVINEVQNSLELTGSKHIMASYACLIEQKLHKVDKSEE